MVLQKRSVTRDGLSYIITPEGEDYCGTLTSEYARAYRKVAKSVIEETKGMSERALIAEIFKLGGKSFRQEVRQ